MEKKIVVVGSSNMDLTVKLKKIPKPGETVIGGKLYTTQGGKGANQAVAASKAGGSVSFITKIGRDEYGQKTIDGFNKQGLDTKQIIYDEEAPSGIAMIFVDEAGNNSIAVASGANENLSIDDIEKAEDIISSANVLLTQLEIPLETVTTAIKIANRNNVKVILNPAPARVLDENLYPLISIITPNIYEAAMLAGMEKIKSISDSKKAAEILLARGVGAVIITSGSKGAIIAAPGYFKHVPAFTVDAVDTTAAGDVFNGVLAVCCANNMDLYESVIYASAAAAISVTKIGAQCSAPFKDTILSFLDRSGIKLKNQL